MPNAQTVGYPAIPQTKNFYRSSTRLIFDEAIHSPDWKLARWENYSLPGQGRKLVTCGKLGLLICKNRHEHPKNKDFARSFVKKCCRAQCPVCAESWASRIANRSTRRVWAYRDRLFKSGERYPNPFQLVVSFPEYMYGLDPDLFKKINRHVRKAVGVTAAVEIFHPWRFDKPNGMKPYFSPHYHNICFGGVDGKVVSELSRNYGIVVTKINTLRDEGSIFKLTKYLLSHAGTRPRTHGVVYTGAISYSKLKLLHEPTESLQCPYCPMMLKPGRIPDDKMPYLTGIPPPFAKDTELLTDYPLEYSEHWNYCFYDPDNYWAVVTAKDANLDKAALMKEVDAECAAYKAKRADRKRRAKSNLQVIATPYTLRDVWTWAKTQSKI